LTPETTAAPDSSTKGQASSLPRRHAAAGATPLTMYGWRGKGHLPALLRRPFEPGQYTSSVFDAYCTENNIRRSLGRTGICYDNAVSESFFATYKKELIHTRPWPSLANLEKETSDWIGNYYNLVRRHSTLGYLTPGEYELGYRQLSQLAA
jgi:transposase InsO family protein